MDFFDYVNKSEGSIGVTLILDSKTYKKVSKKVKEYDALFPCFFDKVREIYDSYTTERGINHDTIDSICHVFKFSDPNLIHGEDVDFAQVVEAKHLELMGLINLEAVKKFTIEDIYDLEYIVFRAFTFCVQYNSIHEKNAFIKSADEIKDAGLSFDEYTGINCLKHISDLFFLKKIPISSISSVKEDNGSEVEKLEAVASQKEYIESEKNTIQTLICCGEISEKIKTIEKHVLFVKKYNKRFYNNKKIEHEHEIKITPPNLVWKDNINFIPVTYNLALILFHRYRLAPTNEHLEELVSVLEYCIRNNFRQRMQFVSHTSIEDKSYTVMFKKKQEREIKYSASNEMISIVLKISDLIKAYFEKFNRHIGFHKYDEAVPSELVHWDRKREFAFFKDKRKASLGLRLEKKWIETLKSLCPENISYDARLVDINKQIEKTEFEMEADIAPSFIVRTIDFIYLLMQTIPYVKETTNDQHELEKLESVYDGLEDIENDFRREIYSRKSILKNYRRETALNIEKIKDAEKDYQHHLELQRERNRVDLLKENILINISALQTSDLDSIMKNRLSFMRNYDLTDEDNDFLDSISLTISSYIKEKVKSQRLFTSLKNEVSEDLSRYNQQVPVNVIETLVTAEYLYKLYIDGKEPLQDFDYSCISALYYQSFEALYNNMIMDPYLLLLEHDPGHQIFWNRMRRNERNRNNLRAEGYGFFPEKRIGQFVNRDGFKHSCMLWDFENMLKMVVDSLPEVQYFSSFLDGISVPGWRDTLPAFVDAVAAARPFRNDASHGGTIVSFNTASNDKERILIMSEFERANMYKNLIKQLLTMIRLNCQ